MGQARLTLIDPGTPPELWQFDQPFSENLRLYGAETIISQLLRHDPSGKDWNLSTMYIEFENNGGAAVSVPTPARSEGLSYYQALSGNRDYLRVPIIATVIESSSSALYPGGNVVRYLAHTVGTVGAGHGLAFTTGLSRVYGGAVVSTPAPDDPSQDVVYSRVYYSSSANQFIKAAVAQIAMEYKDTRE